jgi:hypothetical protein
LLAGLILLSPILVFGLAWAKINRFYHGRQVERQQKLFYLVALVAGSVSTLAYLGYWTWRVCQMYHATLPFFVLLTLDRLIYASRLLSVAAMACLLIWTRTVSLSTGASDSLGDISDLDAWWHHPLGLTAPTAA